MNFIGIDYEKFQHNLSALITNRSMSIKEFSESVEISAPTISRYLSGSRRPELVPIIKIASFCGVSVDWLLGISGEKFDTMPQDVQDIAFSYSIATPDDRKVVEAVLNKYMKKD